MPFIESVKVQGLWGYRTFEVPFERHVNFLIGPNGSGKTALINLIAGALTGDEALLKRESFESVEVFLGDTPNGPRRIQIIKEADLLSSDNIRFILDNEPVRTMRPLRASLYGRRIESSNLQKRLEFAVPVTWLRIDRRNQSSSTRYADSQSAPIDLRLADVSQRLTQYFSEVQSRVDEEMQAFIRFVFSSLIPEEIEAEEASDLDISSEASEGALRQIFENFEINNRKNQRRITKFFQDLRRIDKWMTGSKNVGREIKPRDFLLIALSNTIQSTVARWQKVAGKKDELYSQRRLYLDLLRKMLSQKEIDITNRNELDIRPLAQPEQSIRLVDLSSGEKQVVLMLSEALLQSQAPHIYIADEPELSLHIAWQEELVSVLTQLNPNVQILFATHSPDIIGTRIKNVIDMGQVGWDVAK